MKDKKILFSIDDSNDDLLFIKDVLSGEYDLFTFTHASDAMIALEKVEPNLIICDLRMPEIDGFLFFKNYRDFFPDRDTPVLFLTSVDDPASMTEAYEMGIYDYLIKPINPSVLNSKIRSILNKVKKSDKIKILDIVPENVSFEKLLELLKTELFDKKVVFKDSSEPEIIIKGKNISLDMLENLKNAKKPYRIYFMPVEFENLLTQPDISKATSTGKLSTIKVGNDLITIQTEIRKHPYERLETIATFKGRVVLKREERLNEADDIVQLTESQHNSAENEIKQKLYNKSVAPKTEESFSELYDLGLIKYREGLYEEALKAWERAKKIKPDDKILDVNIEILKKKLNKLSE